MGGLSVCLWSVFYTCARLFGDPASMSLREQAGFRRKGAGGAEAASPDHIKRLRDNPEFAEKFDAKYGAGTADKYLKTPKPEHIAMLRDNPDFADKFDEKYGTGT